ncbi:3'(2'), 5'-bisphosphate nucleotidase [Devosia enhydra]|uniref:3'(2'),5'-bisphosphate nucleotidase CysQ n=1 Tax=Devosia enhydra TaxID=665118 RepID=A0A1K2HT63_9HYPH|nr:3'(2'),5'-bisphosphate nucleotidase CysQ [Devosia enhydra]SFZ81194.1 3'(2'), 5'-bisphosphate nucleotidase [Devosia enhydra]
MTRALLGLMEAAALAGARAIMDVYATEFAAIDKADGSPVTVADARSEAIIIAMLSETGIPVLAEESAAEGRVPELGNRYFVVDPLDGTKEFIKRNGEFTVNIGLVENGRPILGVVLAPAMGEGYSGGAGGAEAFTIVDGAATARRSLKVDRDAEMRVVASRSHGHAALARLCDEMDVVEDVSIGSSLKFCLLARGAARLYPRFTPTWEWDTAAGQAILEAVGGSVLTLDGRPLGYGKSGSRHLNPFFVAADEPELARTAAERMARLLA